ncbi:MAG: cation:proton antiporter [Prolixibacteraceae bacterium]|nr:cation:proton antiporter [Prolixibacteraceae bacterium]
MEFSILKDIVIIFALATLVNFVFTKIKIPTIVGYLITGIIAGPHVLALINGKHEIELMAEIGVILLLFSIGLEFSLKHLLRIRRIVFLGGLMQVMLTALLFFVVSRFYDMTWQSRIFICFMAALSSSALVLKVLQDRSELSSNYGRTVLGILIFQDIMLVPLLLFSNFLGPSEINVSQELIVMLIKTVVIIAFVYVGNKWIMPWLLRVIAMTRNQELFMMSVLLICLAIALMTYELGMSLAFGAFLAGLMISESEYSHNAFGNLIPFKDTFTSFFFVSIGMLLDLNFVMENIGLVAITVLLVIGIKTIVAGGTGFILGHTFKGTVMVGIALSQVGEFSFILAKVGLDQSIITSFHYQLFLAVAVITMSLSPLMIQLARPFSELLLKLLPLPSVWVNGLFPLKEIDVPELKNHTVFIGKDLTMLKLSKLAKYIKLPYISIVFDPHKVRELQKKGENVLYGDAVNESILHKAHVENAEIVAVSIGNLVSSLAIIEKVRAINKHVFILVRARDINDIEKYFEIGADQVVPENFEIAIELFERILAHKLIPQKEINNLVGSIRSDFYGIFREKGPKRQKNVLDEFPNIEISAIEVEEGAFVVGKSLAKLKLRKNAGVTLVAIKRASNIIENPGPEEVIQKDDIVYLLATYEQISKSVELFSKPETQ